MTRLCLCLVLGFSVDRTSLSFYDGGLQQESLIFKGGWLVIIHDHVCLVRCLGCVLNHDNVLWRWQVPLDRDMCLLGQYQRFSCQDLSCQGRQIIQRIRTARKRIAAPRQGHVPMVMTVVMHMSMTVVMVGSTTIRTRECCLVGRAFERVYLLIYPLNKRIEGKKKKAPSFRMRKVMLWVVPKNKNNKQERGKRTRDGELSAGLLAQCSIGEEGI